MSAAGQILYLKIEQNCIVYKRSVTLQDIASVECTDVGILRQVLQEQVYYFSGNEKSSLVQVFSVLDVIRKIHEKYPMLEVENIGEPDFVIRYVPDPEKKSVQYLKTALVCVILFFGSDMIVENHDTDGKTDTKADFQYSRSVGYLSGDSCIQSIKYFIDRNILDKCHDGKCGTEKQNHADQRCL